ncbi:biotin carboxylase [Clostridia bacterium]|nr:biotin carboxylase [Clostridia bacterium]
MEDNVGKTVPKRIATTILNALRGGVVPRIGLEYIAVGRTQEINALLHDVDIIQDGGAAFRFIVGRYGSGKSFLLQTMRNHMMDRGFVVVDADLSPERRFSGTKGQGLATYKELMQNMSTRTKPDGGALPLILEKWISTIQSEVAQSLSAEAPDFDKQVKKRVYGAVNEIEGMVNGFDFANVILRYLDYYKAGDDVGKTNVLRWFRGEYSNKSEARLGLGVNFVISDENWYDFVKLFAVFLVKAGYKGLLVIVDELVNIYRIPYRVTRQYNYEKILTMYNDVLQGKARHLGILMSGTPQTIEDGDKGIYSYDALRSRLTESKFSVEGMKDLLAPVIRLEPLSYEEMFVLIEKLAYLHAGLYEYELGIADDEYLFFLKAEYERIGSGSHITPREVIRDFIEILNILYQNPESKISDILSKGGFTFAKSAGESVFEDDEFADFEV